MRGMGVLLCLVLAWPVAAQQSAAPAPGRGTSPPPRAAECAQLPGGNAPVNKIAELKQPLSPKSLDLTYFNKRLAELTDEDFARIADLANRCNRTFAEAAIDKSQKLREVVRESQAVRRQTLARIERGKAEIAKAASPRDKVLKLHDAWLQLPILAESMTRTDLRAHSAWIARTLQAVYDDAPGYGKRPPPSMAQVMAIVPKTADPVPAASAATPDTRGALPAQSWGRPARSREDE
jgi:hypothetical protein